MKRERPTSKTAQSFFFCLFLFLAGSSFFWSPSSPSCLAMPSSVANRAPRSSPPFNKEIIKAGKHTAKEEHVFFNTNHLVGGQLLLLFHLHLALLVLLMSLLLGVLTLTAEEPMPNGFQEFSDVFPPQLECNKLMTKGRNLNIVTRLNTSATMSRGR